MKLEVDELIVEHLELIYIKLMKGNKFKISVYNININNNYGISNDKSNSCIWHWDKYKSRWINHIIFGIGLIRYGK